ncbi:MAG: lysophospholipid acyltransferase family protein [Candidatus Binatia bacterium]
MPRTLSPLHARLEFAVFSVPVSLMRSLPFPTAFRLGERLGSVAHRLARPQRRVALVNLRIAFPEKSDAERLAILAESWRNFGRIAAEFCHMFALDRANVAERVTFADPDFWYGEAQTVIGSTGILVLTGHVGNWELLCHAIGLYGAPIHLIHRPFRNELVGRFVNTERQRAGTNLVSKRNAAHELIRVLRRRGIVAVPFDQNATGRWGVFADYFSVPASTHPGLARLAELSGAPVYPVFLVRKGGTPKHEIVILPAVETVRSGDRRRDTVENTRRFNRVLEDVVRRHPEQWIWMHKRWRTRPPGEPPIY